MRAWAPSCSPSRCACSCGAPLRAQARTGRRSSWRVPAARRAEELRLRGPDRAARVDRSWVLSPGEPLRSGRADPLRDAVLRRLLGGFLPAREARRAGPRLGILSLGGCLQLDGGGPVLGLRQPDLYSRDQGERLFPIVAFGASIGAVAGSQLTSVLVDPLGVPTMMLVSAGLLLGALFLGGLADRCVSGAARKPRSALPKRPCRKAPPEKADTDGRRRPRGRGLHGGFRLVARSRYLLLIGLLMLLLNFSSSTGEFLLSSLVKEHAEKVAPADVTTFISEFYSNFYFWVNLVGVLIQLFVTSHLLHRFGVRTALVVLPALALVFNIAIAGDADPPRRALDEE